MAAERKLQQLLQNTELDGPNAGEWFMQQFKDDGVNDDCSLKDFCKYFMVILRELEDIYTDRQPPRDELTGGEEENATILRLVAIYTILVDYMLDTYVLDEIAFLVRLIRAVDHMQSASEIEENGGGHWRAGGGDSFSLIRYSTMKVLSTAKGIQFFVVNALQSLREALDFLDMDSLNALIASETICESAEPLTALLKDVRRRQALMEPAVVVAPINGLSDKYKFMEFYDERVMQLNFLDSYHVTIFRQVRNRFLALIYVWEHNQANPEWNFETDCTERVQKIFAKSGDVRVLWQLGQLFIGELLEDPELKSRIQYPPLMPLQDYSSLKIEFGVSEYTDFSTAFIGVVDSAEFLQQLEIGLFVRLVQLYEPEIAKLRNQPDAQLPVDQEVLLPGSMAAMLGLAKLLGYVQTRLMPEHPNAQITTRFRRYVDEVHENGHLMLLTVPWMVQYLIMLPEVALEPHGIRPIILALFDLNRTLHGDRQLPNTALLLRCYLSYLLSQHLDVADMYYDYCSSKLLPEAEPASEDEARDDEKAEEDEKDEKAEEAEKAEKAEKAEEAEEAVEAAEAGEAGEAREVVEYVEDDDDDDDTDWYGLVLERYQKKSSWAICLVEQNIIWEKMAVALKKRARIDLKVITVHLYRIIRQMAINHIIAPVQRQLSESVHAIRHTRFRSILVLVTTIFMDMKALAQQRWQEQISLASDRYVDLYLELPQYMREFPRGAYDLLVKSEVKHMLNEWAYAALHCRDNWRTQMRMLSLDLFMRNNNLRGEYPENSPR